VALFGLPSVGTFRRALGRKRAFGWIPDERHPRGERNVAEFDKLGLSSARAVTATSGYRSLAVYGGPNPLQPPTNSCVLHLMASAERRTLHARYGVRGELGSRLAPYFWTRWKDGLHRFDDGCYPSTAVEVYAENGVVLESAWPFDWRKVNVKPPASVVWDARQRRGVRGTYRIYDRGDALFEALAAAHHAGISVGFGFEVGSDLAEGNEEWRFEWGDRGGFQGRHMVELVALAYVDGQLWGQIANWWPWWGLGSSDTEGGYAWLDQEYLEHASDWTLVDPDGEAAQ